jgi:hypothetical protein
MALEATRGYEPALAGGHRRGNTGRAAATSGPLPYVAALGGDLDGFSVRGKATDRSLSRLVFKLRSDFLSCK